MSEPKLGQLIEGDAERDAIHVAIIPAVAGDRLLPGAKVGRDEDGLYVTRVEPLGIVDPFLNRPVELKDRFWLFLFPNTVTGMRHHWEHPAFVGDEARSASKEWLHRKAEEFDWSYEELVDLAKTHWKHGDLFCGDYEGYDFNRYYPEIRLHIQIATGMTLPETDEDDYFRCAC